MLKGVDTTNRLNKGAAPFGNVEVPSGMVQSEWRPESVSLICRKGECPEQIGVLVFASPKVGGAYKLERCTASLIDSDKILSNGHCDFFATGAGYFIMRTDAKARVVRKITKVLYKTFTPGPTRSDGKPVSSGRPDVAVFQLESGISGISPLVLASGKLTTKIQELDAFVVNDRLSNAERAQVSMDDNRPSNSFDLAIDEIRCLVHRHEATFPFELNERPDMISSFDCKPVEGNSGSPMFPAGSRVVEALLQGGIDGDTAAELILTEQQRKANAYELHSNALATNLRCQSIFAKADPCLVVDEATMSQRFVDKQTELLTTLNARPVPRAEGYQTRFRADVFQLQTPADSQDMEFELLYRPKCRISDVDLKTILYPSSHVKMTFDKWAAPNLVDLEVENSRGTVLRRSGQRFQGKVEWSAPFGAFPEGVVDPRIQLGPDFSFALPVCPL